MWFTVCTLMIIWLTGAKSDSYFVLISGDSNVVLGGIVKLKAELFDARGNPASGNFRFNWRDNAIPFHNATFESHASVSYWNLYYSPDVYAPGPYVVEVVVEHKVPLTWWWIEVARRGFDLNATMFLGGELSVSQSTTHRKRFVATNVTASHQIVLPAADATYINTSKNHIRTFWFVDCMFVEITSGLNNSWNYSLPDTTHYVEALVEASYIPPPPPTTTTTTTTTTSTTTPSTATSTTTPVTTNSSTTTIAPPSTMATLIPQTTTKGVSASNESVTSTSDVNSDQWRTWLMAYPAYNITSRVSQGGFCINTSVIPMAMNSTYGYYQKKIIAKAPVRVVSVNGSGWLKDGDILNMSLTCNGSSPYTYCIKEMQGLYNVTGNETCEGQVPLADCYVGINRLFGEATQYTMVVIISNLVSKSVTPIAVNVYQVTKQPQLSVIVVPVTFSILAFILIIFGVAWYVQSRRSYTVEVADFDFGHQSSDMEYKTFRERLRESFANSFFRTNDMTDNDSNGRSPSRKYGSMQ